MKVIILAAGEGNRLRPLTEHKPKCLVEYRGQPLIDYTRRACVACGIQEIIIVTGYCGNLLQKYGTRCYQNSKYAETNMVASLFCAEAEFNDDLVISYGDIIYAPKVLRALLNSAAEIAMTIDLNWQALWEKRMSNPLDDAESLRLDAAGYVKELGKKPRQLSDIQGQYMGLILFRKNILPRVASCYHGLPANFVLDGRSKDQMYMTSFLQYLIDQGIAIKGVPVKGNWLEVDCPSDLAVNVNVEQWGEDH